jgi:hypothetical protein
MGIQDYGGANDSLANPPLGGPSGWAAAVADAITALQGQHVIRSTRPNGTDHLVEVFDGTAWDLVSYDSGWRDCDALLHTDLTPTEGLKLRRVGMTVYAQCGVSVPAGWAAGTAIATFPAGFTISVMDLYLPLGYSSTGFNSIMFANGSWGLYANAAGDYRSNFAWPTVDAVPTGLPGVAYGNAAPAPPPDRP